MTMLNEAERRTLWAGFMSDMSNRWEPITCSKHELLAAIGKVETWLDNNQALFEAANPPSIKTFGGAWAFTKSLFSWFSSKTPSVEDMTVVEDAKAALQTSFGIELAVPEVTSSQKTDLLTRLVTARRMENLALDWVAPVEAEVSSG